MRDDQELLKAELERLRNMHTSVDVEINRMLSAQPVNQLAAQRLKKQKLALKDQIEKIRSKLMPDIIA